MGFWFSALIWFGTSVVAALLRRSPEGNDAQPAGLGDFSFPTAQEDRVVPIMWGTNRLEGPNVIWYGDLETEAITRTVSSGNIITDFFGGEVEQTIGYRYYLGVQLGFCRGGEWPVEEIRKIWVGEELLWEGSFVTSGDVIAVDRPDFFGGTEGPSANGGFIGDFRFYFGENLQPQNGYLAGFQNPLPAYRNLCYAVLERGYVGNSPRVDRWSVEASRWPNQLGVTGGAEKIGDDANPVCVMYEIFTSDRWGGAIDPADINTIEWREAATQAAAEGLGFSMVLDKITERYDLLAVVLNHLDATLYSDPLTRQLRITLIRGGYDVGALPVFDAATISDFRFSLGGYDETANQVAVNFLDRARSYTPRIAFAQDAANLSVLQETVTATERSPGAKTAAVANIIAAREMRSKSLPAGQGSFKVNRSAFELNPGDPFIINWPDAPIEGLIARVQQLRPGTATDGRIAVDFLKDNYGLEVPTFADPQPTGWVPPVTVPTPALRERLWELPFQLAPAGGRYVGVLATRASGLQTGYEIWSDLTGGSDFEQTGASAFTPSGLLDGGIGVDLGDVTPYTQDIRVNGLSGAALDLIIDAGATEVDDDQPTNLILIDDEVCWFESVTDNLDGSFDLVNVHRGALDTIPAAHGNDSIVWFIGLGIGSVTQDALALTVTAPAVRVLPFTQRGVLDIGDASTLSLTLAERYAAPIPANDPAVNGLRIVDLDGWASTMGTLALTWKTRNRATQPLGTKQDDSAVVPSGSVSYTVTLRRADNDAAVITQENIPAGAYTAQGFIPQSTPGVPDELDFYFELDTLRAGQAGQQWVSRDFAVRGYAIDYGAAYAGGADAGGGIVLDQAAAPFIPDPLPGLAEARRWALNVGGAYSASDDLQLQWTINDTLNGDLVSFNTVLNGGVDASLAEYAETVASDLIDELAGRPFTMIRSGTQVQISTRYGTAALRQANLAAPGGLSPTVQQRQQAAPPVTPTRQRIYLDFWTTEEVLGVELDVLAPFSGAEYAVPGTLRAESLISGLTYDAEQSLPAVNRTVRATASVSPVLQLHSGEFTALRDNLQADELSAFYSVGIGTFTGFTFPMQRNGVVLTLEPNYRINPQLFETVANVAPSGYKLLFKEGTPPVAGDPAGLPQITEAVFFLEDADYTGLSYSITIDGNRRAATVAGSGQAALEVALDALRDDITANVSGITAERVDSFDFQYRLQMRGAASVSFEVSAAATTGVEVTFSETTP